MKTVTLRGLIGEDGVMKLEVPCDLPAGPAEVVVVVQPEAVAGNGTRNDAADGDSAQPSRSAARPARSGVFQKADLRDQDLDVDAALDEMNQMWKDKLSDLLP